MEKASIPGDKQADESKAKAEMVKKLTTEEKVALRREENEEKEKLLEREKENYTRILALKCYDGWLKLYDNSAIIVSTWLSVLVPNLAKDAMQLSFRKRRIQISPYRII